MTHPLFGTFFLPGPTEVRANVLAAMTQPMMPHRGAQFEALFGRVQDGLRHVFRTTRPVYVSTSSATGLMEAAIRCAPAGPMLSLVNGAFSERFAAIARGCGRETHVLHAPLGTVHDLRDIEAALTANKYAAMTVVHSETSTGALADIAALAALAHRYGTAILVDSVTGVAGAPVETDAWQLDFVLTGSQKALALPPGLAFGVASESFLAHARATKNRGLYFDIVEFEEYAQRNQTPNTPALPLLYAADVQLSAIRAEGIEARWARHTAMAQTTWEWTERCRANGLDTGILAPVGARSLTVSAITVPAGLTGGQIVKRVGEQGFVIGGGYGALKDRTFRIGHMGDHTVAGLANCLAACERALHAGR